VELVWRIAQVIIPVFFIVAVGFFYARRRRPDLTTFNRVVLDVMTPVLVYTALAGKEFRLVEQAPLLAAGGAETGTVSSISSRTRPDASQSAYGVRAVISLLS
jgi:predicted permease